MIHFFMASADRKNLTFGDQEFLLSFMENTNVMIPCVHVWNGLELSRSLASMCTSDDVMSSDPCLSPVFAGGILGCIWLLMWNRN